MDFWTGISYCLGIIEAFLFGELWAVPERAPNETTMVQELTNKIFLLNEENEKLRKLNDEYVIQGVTYLEFFEESKKEVSNYKTVLESRDLMIKSKNVLIKEQKAVIEDLKAKIYKMDEYMTNVDQSLKRYENEVSDLKKLNRAMEMRNKKYVIYIKEKNLVNDYKEWVTEFNKRV